MNYTYDGLGRVASRGTDTFTYTGFSLDPSSDGEYVYGRSPGGSLLSIADGSETVLVGRDRHGDVTHLFDASGSVEFSSLYDPFGDATTTAGIQIGSVGFQGDWTDPDSEHVWMGARWYDGGWATFLSRDTVFGELSTSVSLNRYTYAHNNPLSMWDPDGRCPDYLKSVNGGAAWEECRGFQDELGRQGSLRLKGVELLRNYVSDWYEQWESIGTKPKPASRSNWRRLTDFVGDGIQQVGGVFKGVAEGGVDFLVGTGTIVKDGVTGIAALGAYYGYERWAGGDEPGWGARTIMGLDTKYDAVWGAVKSDWVNALFGTERIKAEWAEGNYGEALGHGLFTALLYTAPIKPIAAKPHVTTNIASRLTNYTVTRTSPSLFPVTRGIESRLANYTVTAAEAAIRPGATAVTAANNLSRATAAAEVSAAGSSRAMGGVGAPLPQTYYPPNNGFWGEIKPMVLEPGTRIDRYGALDGSYVSPAGTPYWERALPYGWKEKPYSVFEVLKPFDVQAGRAAPWFGMPGGGTQYHLPKTIQELIESGMIKRVGR